jgi:DDE family transposase
VDADLLVTAHTQHQIDVVGPPFGSYSHQRRAGQGYDLSAFVINWEAQYARCPQGHTSIRWTPGRDVSGDPVVRIRFHAPTCRACPVRPACTQAKDAPRQLTVRPQAHHEAIQAARQRQETTEFTAQYARRAGIEGTQSQAVRRCGLRQCRYIGYGKTRLQHVLTATALNLVRVVAWLEEKPRAMTRRSAFAALAA